MTSILKSGKRERRGRKMTSNKMSKRAGSNFSNFARPPHATPVGVPPGLQTVIARCLAKDPQERYQTAAEVKVALEMMDSGDRLRLAPRRRAPSWKLALITVLFVGLASGVLFRVRHLHPKVSTANQPRI